MSTNSAPIRILQVVGGMNRAGTETWLMHILRHIDRGRFQIDFLVHTIRPGDYDREISALGCQIFPCPNKEWPWIYALQLKHILDKYGPYDIVHSHVHHFSGYVLNIAKQAGVKILIAHSHNDTSSIDAQADWYRALYLSLMKWLIIRQSTVGLATSRQAAPSLFGANWERNPRWKILYCGIDLKPFNEEIEQTNIRLELGIPAEAYVIGHIGRFESQKNHRFLIDVAAEVIRQEPNTYLLLVGKGVMRLAIEHKVAQLGLEDRVIFAGTRNDIPRLMIGAMDIFLFPSLYEGLGLVLIEAQSAGLPCIFSNTIPLEADIVNSLIHRVSLDEPAINWAKKILNLRKNKSTITRTEALNLVKQSSFNIINSVKKLENFYLRQLCR
ncbi:glycosyltransferase family 1 protein [Acaryochloris marina NIES-2412]|uniref:glycosyltransferase family 1 protein n=1 Tax=Acaryochloris marina TaxID=155978 RepID=UPI00405A3FB9